MNDVQYLIDRQLGIGGHFNYDNILRRLVVRSDECYYGLQSGFVDPGFEQDPPIFACKFAEVSGYEHILALANEDGRVAIQDTSKVGGGLEGFQCHNNAVFDLAWLPGELKFVTVSGDHTAALWDAGGGDVRRVAVLAAHARSVKTAAVARAGAAHLLATGARDGHVLLWDLRGPAPAARLPALHAAPPRTPPRRRAAAPARAASVTALALRDASTLLSAGEGDPNVKLWDLRRAYSAHARAPLPARVLPYCGASARAGYTQLLLDAAGARLYAACMDGVVYCFNLQARAALPERRFAGHRCGSFYVRAALSPCGDYLLSGSSDRRAYLWSTRRRRPLLRLHGHRAEVTCAAWRHDARAPPALLVTCGDDARHLLWRVGPEEPPPDDAVRGRAEPLPRAPAPSPAPPSPPPAPPRAAPRSKRCLAELLGAAPPAKRARAAPSPPSPPRKRPPGPEADASPPKRLRAEEAWGAAPTAGCSFKTPPKNSAAAGQTSPRTPERAGSPRLRALTFRTPTKQLPDWVRDGEAPHLRLMSPGRRRAEPADWLTRLRRARSGSPGAGPPGAGPPPARRTSTTEKTPKSAKKSKTLLKYFPIVSKTEK